MQPKISIIIPTYNRANYVEQTIESALAQDYENYEVIVSDNASTDTTTEVINKYLKNDKFKYYKNETNIGMVKNWHKALYDYSTGDWFLILSDDDYFIDSSYLTKAVELMLKDESVHIVYANGYIKHEDTGEMVALELPFDEINEGKKIFLSRGTIKPQDFTLCNILFKKEKALQLKPFENEFNIGCDSELFLKMCIYGKVGIVQDYVSVYRVHASNLIKEVNKNFDIFLNTLEFIIEPCRRAKESNKFSKEELNMFEEKRLLPYLKGNFIMCKVFFPKNLNLFIDKIENSIFQKIKLNVLDYLKIMLFKNHTIFKFYRYINAKIR